MQEDDLLRDWKEHKARLLIVSEEGKYTFSHTGFIEDFNQKFIILNSIKGKEMILRNKIIKIREDRRS